MLAHSVRYVVGAGRPESAALSSSFIFSSLRIHLQVWQKKMKECGKREEKMNAHERVWQKRREDECGKREEKMNASVAKEKRR